MKTVRITIGIVLLLMSLMFVSCSSDSGKREPKTTTERVVHLVGESGVFVRELHSAYAVGDTVRVLMGVGTNQRMGLVVVVR